jgi:outer membrane protein OmpA-like peptidoglycan-associated protein
VVEVAGHTDSSGSDQYNQQLSQRRASAVAGYLGSHGVNSQRLLTVGAGESYPIASNDTESGRAANRRVEMTIVPITKG